MADTHRYSRKQLKLRLLPYTKKNSVASVREKTIPILTERPLLVDEVSATFCR
jgi:hypothetical protein